MSAIARLAAFFVEPAVPGEVLPPATCSSSSRECAAAAPGTQSAPGREHAPVGGAGGDGHPPEERPIGESTDRRVPRPDDLAVGSLDGTAVRRLAVSCEAVARPSLRLLPPLEELTAEDGGELDAGGGDRLASERSPRGSTPAPVVEDAVPRSPRPDSGPDERFDGGRRSTARGSRAQRVCVLGDGRSSAAFARALAGRLAGAPGTRCAILARVAELPGSGGPPAATARPAARRVSRALLDGGLDATARGRLVELTLSDAGSGLAEAAGLPEPPPIVLALPGTRTRELDALLTGCDLVLLVVRAETPATLAALAVTGLERTTPGTAVRAITLPARGGGAARRAALNVATDALR